MLAQEPVDAADPAGETGDVAIEDRKFREQQQEADVERPPEKLFRGLDPGGKAGGGAVELVVLVDVARQDPFGRGEEVEVVRVALEIEVRPAGVVGGDGGEGEGGGRGRSGGLVGRRRLGGGIEHWGGPEVGATKTAVRMMIRDPAAATIAICAMSVVRVNRYTIGDIKRDDSDRVGTEHFAAAQGGGLGAEQISGRDSD